MPKSTAKGHARQDETRDVLPARAPSPERETKDVSAVNGAGTPTANGTETASGANGLAPESQLIAKKFDFEKNRLPQHFETGVVKRLMKVPIRKPSKMDFIRVHPEHHYETLALLLKEERETYVVVKNLWEEAAGFAVPISFRRAINRQGVESLWPLQLPGADGRSNEWHESALAAASEAVNDWVRVSANMSLKGYDVHVAPASFSPPNWSNVPFGEILEIAFRGCLIDSYDHPVLKRLRGEA